ncbi:MAG TPA: polyprenyl synthetase family protein [Kiritimatiellia bacterium]|nr:polyprenyl synthetase family protein [Kiritimatiellia bacterium]HMP33309.1 polyprenyl synthetase family protein [Kiritimatiellia bacterium]
MIARPDHMKKAPVSRLGLLDAAGQEFVAAGFSGLLPVDAGVERHLRGVIDDTLSHPGSLARAHLAYSLMRSFEFDPDVARHLGVAIEYFHTASLLLDDLPCMDNATMRRGTTCPHIVHGEAAAILGALALITRAYNLLWSVFDGVSRDNRNKAAELVHQCLGVKGILNGQSYDLHFSESDRRKEDVLRVAQGKTVTLIRLTLLLPVHIHGAGPAVVELVERLAASWGLAYQILDDFKDLVMSDAETGKTTARDEHLDHPNLPRVMGVARAADVLAGQLEESRGVIAALYRLIPGSEVLDRLQSMLETEQGNVHARLRTCHANRAITFA